MGDESQRSDRAGVAIAGGESAGGESAGIESAGGESAGGESAGIESAGGESAGGESAGIESAGIDRTGDNCAGDDCTGIEQCASADHARQDLCTRPTGTVVSTAVLLAAGRGKRLRPWTDTVPKPLLVHQGKATLDYQLESLQQAGVVDVVLVIHHLAEQIEAYAEHWNAKGSLRIRCVTQPAMLGTAHALNCVSAAVPELLQHPFVLSATDYLIPVSFFPTLLASHASHPDDLIVSLKRLTAEEASARSSVRFADGVRPVSGESGALRITEIVEKPAPGTAPSDVGANLTFVLPPDILQHAAMVEQSERGEHEIQSALNTWMATGGRGWGVLQDTPAEWQGDTR